MHGDLCLSCRYWRYQCDSFICYWKLVCLENFLHLLIWSPEMVFWLQMLIQKIISCLHHDFFIHMLCCFTSLLHIKYFFYSACNILASPSLDFKLTDSFYITKGAFCLIFQHFSRYSSLLLFDSVQGARSDSYFTVQVYAQLGKYLLGSLCLILSIPCECTMF